MDKLGVFKKTVDAASYYKSASGFYSIFKDLSHYSFDASKSIKEKQVILTPGRSKMLIVFCQHPANSPVISIYSEKQKKTARVNPVSGKYWRIFQPVIDAIELKWNGGF
jgi:hypothetical protein